MNLSESKVVCGWYFMGPASTSSSRLFQSPSSSSSNCVVLRSYCKEVFLPNETFPSSLEVEEEARRMAEEDSNEIRLEEIHVRFAKLYICLHMYSAALFTGSAVI